MKQENYLEGIYGCLERIEKKVEALPVEGTSPTVENRTISPEGIAELKIRLERLQSVVEKNSSEIAAVRSHTARLSEGRPLSAETFAGKWKRQGSASWPEIIERISHYYGIEIDQETTKVPEERFTGSFLHEDVNNVLRNLQVHYHFTYTKTGNHIKIKFKK